MSVAEMFSRGDAASRSESDEIGVQMTFQRKSDLRVKVTRAAIPRDKTDTIYEAVIKEIAREEIGDSHNFVSAVDVNNRFLATGEGLRNYVIHFVAQMERRARQELQEPSPRKGF